MASEYNVIRRCSIDPSQFGTTIEQFSHATVQSAHSCPSAPASASKIQAFSWLKIINENKEVNLGEPPIEVSKHNLGKILPVSIEKGSNLYNIVAWTICIQKVLKLDPIKAIEIIQTAKLGGKLSQCAEYICAIPAEIQDDVVRQMAFQIRYTAVELLKTQSHYYFHQTTNWKNGRDGLKRSHSAEADQNAQCLQKTVSTLPKEPGSSSAWVIAKDTVQDRLWISQSGRTWAVNSNKLAYWAKNKLNWKRLVGNRLSFCTLIVDSVTMEMISKITAIYVEFCRSNSDRSSVSHFTDFNKVRGDFCARVVKLFATRPDAAKRTFILSRMQKYFPDALPEEKWKQLFKLVDKKTVSQQDVAAVVMNGKSTCDQLIAMSTAVANCGEFKIALEFCRELSILPEESQKLLPKTLGERLEIYAFKSQQNVDSGKRERMRICERCCQLWNVYEALYWSIRSSGLNLSMIEKLDRVLA